MRQIYANRVSQAGINRSAPHMVLITESCPSFCSLANEKVPPASPHRNMMPNRPMFVVPMYVRHSKSREASFGQLRTCGILDLCGLARKNTSPGHDGPKCYRPSTGPPIPFPVSVQHPLQGGSTLCPLRVCMPQHHVLHRVTVNPLPRSLCYT